MAVAEALDMTLQNAQLVTVAQLDGQIKLLEERMKRLELRLMIWIAAVVFGNSHLGEVISFIASFLRTPPN